MKNLREKGHVALANHRAGRPTNSTLSLSTGSMSSPVDNIDELATLGGRTRVVTRHDSLGSPGSVSASNSPSAGLSVAGTGSNGPTGGLLGMGLGPGFPAVSPSTANRMVPVPIYADAQGQQNVHPGVLEYMRTFATAQGSGSGYNMQQQQQQQQMQQQQYQQHQQLQHQQHQLSPSAIQHGSSDYDFSNQSMSYNNTGVSTNMSTGMSSGMSSGMSTMSNPTMTGQGQTMMGYPQYFPVFDYGPAGGEAAFPPLSQSGLAQGELALAPSTDGQAESPHSTWNAFVAGLGM
jgi:hypothetical protein